MLIVDRIEDGIAVIERDSGRRMEVPAEMLAEDVREGDVVMMVNGLYLVRKDATEKRRREIAEMQNDLWED